MKPLLPFFLLVAIHTSAFARGYKASDSSQAMRRAAFYEPAIEAAAARHSVSSRLLWTIAYLESRFQPQLVSPKGARGMMQFIPATGRRYGLLTLRDLHDPLRSIDAAARYLRDLVIIFNGRVDLVLAGYNAGEKAVINRNFRVPPFRETRAYVARGLSLFVSVNNRFSPSVSRIQPKAAVKRPHVAPSRPRPTRSIYFHS